MPVGFNSPARNLFLLGSTGAQLVTNFFKTIDRTAGTDGVYLPDEIRYNIPDQKYILAGTASDSQSKDFGWFEKRTEAGVADWQVEIQSTLATTDTSLRAFEIDKSNNLIVAGKTGTVPWVAKYTTGGSISWQVTTNTPNLEYTGIAIDSSNNIYACGNTPTPSATSSAYIEKYDTSGTPNWSKSATFIGRDVILTKCAVNNKGEVIAVGIIEDDSAYKGYIVKVNANTGEILWDRTIRTYAPDITFGYKPTFCEDVYVDGNNQIYVVGRLFGISETRSFLIKYSPEGNIIWQRETPPGETINHYFVRADTDTGQIIVYSQYFGLGGMLSKYSRNGDLVFRRLIYSSFNGTNAFGPKGLDADASNYYLLFVDDPVDLLAGDPKRYTFGKVSSSGNGLGNFTYSEGTGQTIYYQSSTIQDKIGRLSDGSVRQDSSDLLTYPFSANKLLFDDLATQVANKKVQIDEPNVFQYGATTNPSIAYPRISNDSIVYDSSLLLNYDFSNPSSYNYNHNLFPGSDFSTNNSPENTTLTTNSALAPDGSFTAASVDGNPGTLLKYFYKGYSTTTTGTYTTSVYAKYKNEQFIVLRINDNGGVNGALQRFDILNGTKDGIVGVGGTATNGSSTITPVGNGWYRLSVTVTFNSALVQVQGSQVWLTAYSNTSSTGGVYIWGSQLVFGSNILPYTKTTSTNILPSTSASNLSSTSYTGTINGAIFNSAGYFDFNGTSSNININNTLSSIVASNLPASWESWVYLIPSNNNEAIIGNGFSNGGVLFRKTGTEHAPANRIRFLYFTNGGNGTGFDSSTIFTEGWYHFIAIYNGSGLSHSNFSFYVNGSIATITNPTFGAPTTVPTTTNFSIGAVVSESTNYWNGNIGEVRIYNRALTAQEVSQNYNATRSKYGV